MSQATELIGSHSTFFKNNISDAAAEELINVIWDFFFCWAFCDAPLQFS